ncbi:hypothetical protein [Microcoleus vaginatus]|uniref:hypothetical protein n=1 Tax=Microcoleus vaginatus TaxID=119532 RepID=UPI001F61384D
MPVPQENSSLVEWAGEPVLDNGARFKFKLISCTIVNNPFMNTLSGLFHKKSWRC